MTAVLSRPDSSSGEPVVGSGRSVVGRRIVTAVTTVVVALVVLAGLWAALLRIFDVSTFVGKTPIDVWNYLFSSEPAEGRASRVADGRRRPDRRPSRRWAPPWSTRPSASSPAW